MLVVLAVSSDHTARWNLQAEHWGRDGAESLGAALLAETPTPSNAVRLAHEWMLAEPPQVYAVRTGRRIGGATVAEIEARVHQLRLLDDHIGGGDSYNVVTAELTTTAELLRDASYTEQVARRLSPWMLPP